MIGGWIVRFLALTVPTCIDQNELALIFQCIDVSKIDPIGAAAAEAVMKEKRLTIADRLVMDAHSTVCRKRHLSAPQRLYGTSVMWTDEAGNHALQDGPPAVASSDGQSGWRPAKG